MVLSFFQVCHHPGNVTTYVINWAERFGPGEDGTPTVLAKGLLSLHKDGSFQVDYNKRPYRGQWSLADQRMSLTAGWLNGGEASVAPVERVTGYDTHIPLFRLEMKYLPSVDKIVAATKRTLAHS